MYAYMHSFRVIKMHLCNAEISCGVYQMAGLEQDLPEFLRIYEAGGDIDYGQTYHAWPFILFSDNTENGNGEYLCEELNKHKELGSCKASPIRYNPNSGKMIRVWTWAPSKSYMRKVEDKLASWRERIIEADMQNKAESLKWRNPGIWRKIINAR